MTGASRAWEFGDEQPLDVIRTVTRAVLRSGIGTPVKLEVEDFEVVETERRASAAVALLVDLSWSMELRDYWGPMKQTALALSHLVATKFPQDALQIIGFGLSAMPMSQNELAAAEVDPEKGTNLQHALRLAGRHLRKHSDSEPVVLIVTDGEPTAHNTAHGPIFWWPPTRETVEATIVDAVAKRSNGRVFSPSAEDLGRYVVTDYLRARRGRRA